MKTLRIFSAPVVLGLIALFGFIAYVIHKNGDEVLGDWSFRLFSLASFAFICCQAIVLWHLWRNRLQEATRQWNSLTDSAGIDMHEVTWQRFHLVTRVFAVICLVAYLAALGFILTGIFLTSFINIGDSSEPEINWMLILVSALCLAAALAGVVFNILILIFKSQFMYYPSEN